MRSWRFYSTCKVPGVPRNSLKHRDGLKNAVPSMVPSPSHIVHPFYAPSTTEEIVACSTETFPALLDGKPIVPSLINDPGAATYRLEMSSLKFRCVRGVSSWLGDLKTIRDSSSQSEYKVLNEAMVLPLLKPSKITRMNHPLIMNLKQLFSDQGSYQINPSTLDAIIEQFVSDKGLGVFSEDVFLYLLQHHVNSTGKIVTIIESIKSHLSTDIDQLRVVEELVLQTLVSLKKNQLQVTPNLTVSFDGLLKAINNRFQLENCTTHFQPIVCGAILEFYIKIKKLNESKRVISGLISRRFIPAEKETVAYLKVMNDQLAHNKTQKDFLKAFALISDFRPIIERARNPLIFTYLLPLCRHISEVKSLLSVIKNSKNVKEMLDVNLIPFINRTNHIKNDRSLKSAHLCSLYRMASPFYDNKLPNKFSEAFLLSFADLQNYTMMASIMKRDSVAVSSDLFDSLISKLERSHPQKTCTAIEISDAFRVEFVRRFMVPLYLSLPQQARLQFIPQIKRSGTLSSILRAGVSASGQTD